MTSPGAVGPSYGIILPHEAPGIFGPAAATAIPLVLCLHESLRASFVRELDESRPGRWSRPEATYRISVVYIIGDCITVSDRY